MREDEVRELLEAVRTGRTTLDVALDRLRDLPFADVGVAHVDHHRELRTGMPEVIFCAGKTPDEIARIASHMAERGRAVLGTRCDAAMFTIVHAALPTAVYNERARVFRVPGPEPMRLRGLVAVVSAGTSDRGVAEEALETLHALGAPCESIQDVGVAGLHRLLAHRDRLAACDVQIVVAGMEGALASVAAGLTGKPTIAVPTSVGYGAAFGGLAALLGMLNSCATGVTVVNIDNGFGAAAAAAAWIRQLRGADAAPAGSAASRPGAGTAPAPRQGEIS